MMSSLDTTEVNNDLVNAEKTRKNVQGQTNSNSTTTVDGENTKERENLW